MKIKELNELRTKEVSVLYELVAKKRLEVFEAASKLKVGKEKNLKKGKNLRREIAKLETIIRERQLIANLEKTAGSKPADESSSDMSSSFRGNRGLESAEDVMEKENNTQKKNMSTKL